MKDASVASVSTCQSPRRAGRRPMAAAWATTLAALALAFCGCSMLSGPPARPIDGLRMTGRTEQAAPASASKTAGTDESSEGELKRLDLRV